MTYKWCKSKFTAAELNGKSVSFSIPLERGGIAQGEGKLQAKENAEGLIAVSILKPSTAPDFSQVRLQVIFVPAEAVDSIVRNPPGSKSEFAINAA